MSGNRHINIRHEGAQNKGKIEEKVEGFSRSQKNAKSKASFDFLDLFLFCVFCLVAFLVFAILVTNNVFCFVFFSFCFHRLKKTHTIPDL